jgi:hypothetical protein
MAEIASPRLTTGAAAVAVATPVMANTPATVEMIDPTVLTTVATVLTTSNPAALIEP